MVGEVPWGTHFCQFYESPRDVVETFVPFLAGAVARGEGCVWVTDALPVADAEDALRAAVPDLEARLRRGQIEILDGRAYYLRDGRFDAEAVFAAFLAKTQELHARGFPSGRLAATSEWLDRPDDFENMVGYEGRIHHALAGERLLCLCGYTQRAPRPVDVAGTVCSHAFSLARRHGVWARFDPIALGVARDELHRRDEFLASASRKLGTPLDSLWLAAQALRSKKVGLSPAKRARALGLIERQSRRLLGLARELSDASSLLEGHLELDLAPVDLADVVRAACDQLRDDFSRAECPLELRAPGGVAVGRWDRGRLQQVLVQLLSNAMKFGTGKPIHVSLERTATACRLAVEDHGMGIPPERLAHLFEPFQRSPSVRHPAGLGLGLYLVRAVVERLGGTVRVESRLAAGSRFTVELPCESPPPKTARS